MEIFKWAKEVESIYANLIEKAKEQSILEIQNIREEQEKILEESIQKKQELIKSTFKELSTNVNEQIGTFESKLIHKVKLIEEQYLKNKEALINKTIKKLGFDFNG